mmetsp:Transcript_89315/g.273533  ORF Transcript_89315/g.273533 Transcript_89315/m.273533 type:complete len:211 (-) Transcript_89315:1945-2577(-)
MPRGRSALSWRPSGRVRDWPAWHRVLSLPPWKGTEEWWHLRRRVREVGSATHCLRRRDRRRAVRSLHGLRGEQAGRLQPVFGRVHDDQHDHSDHRAGDAPHGHLRRCVGGAYEGHGNLHGFRFLRSGHVPGVLRFRGRVFAFGLSSTARTSRGHPCPGLLHARRRRVRQVARCIPRADAATRQVRRFDRVLFHRRVDELRRGAFPLPAAS